MSDDIDRANEQAQAQLEAALTVRRHVPEFMGYCLWCEEDVHHGAFCSSDCREMYEMAAKMKAIRGQA